MIKKILSVFFDILLKILPIRPVFRLLRKYKILLLLILAACLIALILWLRTFSMLDLLLYKKQLFELIEDKPFLTAVSFFLVYVIVSTISLPGTTVLSFSGGFLFGFIKGFLISLFAVSIGSSFAFLITRYFLRDFFIKKAGSKLEKIYKHLKTDEIYYLFAFRLFPFTPLFFTNMLMGLTSMSLRVFFVTSFIAFLPILFIYVNIGSQLSELESWSGLTDFDLIVSFTFVGIFPLAVRYIFKLLKKLKKSREEFPLDSEQFF